MGEIWFTLWGTRRGLTAQGDLGLVTGCLYFHFERVHYWFMLQFLIESHRNKRLSWMEAVVYKQGFVSMWQKFQEEAKIWSILWLITRVFFVSVYKWSRGGISCWAAVNCSKQQHRIIWELENLKNKVDWRSLNGFWLTKSCDIKKNWFAHWGAFIISPTVSSPPAVSWT